MLGRRDAHPTYHRQVHRETVRGHHPIDGVSVARSRFFGHLLPPGHDVFESSTIDFRTVSGVMTNGVGVGSDPLAGALTQVLTVPLRELYAVLWRFGVIEIVD
ncbi:Rv1535 domain-containing protein [Nocardia sp. NPDC004278]